MPRKFVRKKKFFKKKVVRKNNSGRRFVKAVARTGGETKLIKTIRDGPFNVTEPYMLVTPYQESVTNAGVAVQWPQYNDATNIHGREWIKVGPAYDQRIGRRVWIKGTTVELRGNLVSGATSGEPDYPLYAKLRVIHGWCKNGYDSLNQVQMDLSGGSMYKEIPFSKYKILSDRVIIKKVHPSVSIGSVASSTVPGRQSAVYAPLKFKFKWSGGKMTFADSLASPQIGHGATYHGWCPFFIVMNPNHGAADNSLNFNVEWIKRVIAYKDA
jgi:hypothetical protein